MEHGVTMEVSTANRNYKDTVFRMLFSDKENLLSLYNAVAGRNYKEVLHFERIPDSGEG